MNPCEQKDNILHIQEELTNHKIWRKDTSASLANIEIQLATLNERLKSKLEGFDEHVKAGTAFRASVIGIGATLILTIITAVYCYGGLAKQVEVNTAKWAHVEQGK